MVCSQLYSRSFTKKQGLNNAIVVLRRDEKWYAETNKYSCKRKKEKRCSGFCGKFRISIFNKTLTNSRSGSGWCARTVLQRLKLHVYSFEEHKLGWCLLAQTMICFLAEYRFEGGEIILSHCQPCTNQPTVLSKDHHNLPKKAGALHSIATFQIH